ncbi:hypothetical protein [Methyloraptor flagellatus]|uniref:MptD family ECF transporter S component n=1 Tax=Methyloraptor flagellatus TaxID=3162530 RepID=A0AAU7XF97_9HYPH
MKVEDDEDDGWGPVPTPELRVKSRNLAAAVLGFAAFLIAEVFLTTPYALVVGAASTAATVLVWPLLAVTATRISVVGGLAAGIVAFVAAYVPGLVIATLAFRSITALTEGAGTGVDDIELWRLVGQGLVYTGHLTLPLGAALGAALAFGTRVYARTR